MHAILTSVGEERGQAIILFVGIFTIIMVIGAIVVDFGLWTSERRGAQKDADATSLAGVQAYLGDLSDTNEAFADAVEWAVKNGVDPAEIDGASTSDCSDGNSCIEVGIGNCREDGTDLAMPWVQAKIRHNSRSLFASIFGVFAPDIGAVARACVGSPHTFTNNSPFGQQVGLDENGEPLSSCMEPYPNPPPTTRPIYGSVCILKTSANANESGQFGLLTLSDGACGQSGANLLRHHIRYEALGPCSLGFEVNTGTGNAVGLLQALRDRLLQEGTCDEMFFTGNVGFDDFNEVFSLAGADPGDPIVPSADNVFSENTICRITEQDDQGHTHTYQPRVLSLLLVDYYAQGDQTTTIAGRAAYYVIGCYHRDESDATKAAIEQDLNQIGSFLNRCQGATGQHDVLGIFVQELEVPMDVRDPDPNLGLAIVLVK